MIRVFLLVGLIAFGHSLVWILPRQGELQDSAMRESLPEDILGWRSQEQAPSKEERQALASDTLFSKRNYYRKRLDEGYDVVNVSVVYSGHDMNNSIHRPERCFAAQGHFDLNSVLSSIRIGGAEKGEEIPIQRLTSKVQVAKDEQGVPVIRDSVGYYLFVGETVITPNHYRRVMYDIMDRLFEGYDQRWAFVMFTATVGSDSEDGRSSFSESEADEALREVAEEVLKRGIRWEKLRTIDDGSWR